MGDHAELIARLRQTARDFASNGIASEAADALSSLVRERDELRATNRELHRRAQQAESDIRAGRDEIIKARSRDQWGGMDRAFLQIYHENRDLRSRATAAEADAARMREALSKIDIAWEAALNGKPSKAAEITGWTGSLDNYGQIFAWIARNALGGKDE